MDSDIKPPNSIDLLVGLQIAARDYAVIAQAEEIKNPGAVTGLLFTQEIPAIGDGNSGRARRLLRYLRSAFSRSYSRG